MSLPAAGAGEDVEFAEAAFPSRLMGLHPLLQAPVAMVGLGNLDVFDAAIDQQTAGVLDDVNLPRLVLIAGKGLVLVDLRVAMDVESVAGGQGREHIVPIDVEIHSSAGNLEVVGVFVVNDDHA